MAMFLARRNKLVNFPNLGAAETVKACKMRSSTFDNISPDEDEKSHRFKARRCPFLAHPRTSASTALAQFSGPTKRMARELP